MKALAEACGAATGDSRLLNAMIAAFPRILLYNSGEVVWALQRIPQWHPAGIRWQEQLAHTPAVLTYDYAGVQKRLQGLHAALGVLPMRHLSSGWWPQMETFLHVKIPPTGVPCLLATLRMYFSQEEAV